MTPIELFITAVALAQDAFAVSVCKGLSAGKVTFRNCLTAGLWFGIFQALMPLIGYLTGSLFAEYITAIDHWIAFALLVGIGVSMLVEALKKEEDKREDKPFAFKTMLVMAIATSIDALAVGVSFAFLNANIWIAVAFIGGVTLILSALGVFFGSIFGTKHKKIAEITGGVILILMGIKILLEHLSIITF